MSSTESGDFQVQWLKVLDSWVGGRFTTNKEMDMENGRALAENTGETGRQSYVSTVVRI